MAGNREMCRKRDLVIVAAAIVFGVWCSFGCSRSPEGRSGSTVVPPEPQLTVQEGKSVEYHLARILRDSIEPEVSVIISVDPSYFVLETMVKLAHQLKHDFSDIKLLLVEILDDQYIADNYVPAGGTYRGFYKARRGTYRLNRITNRERLEFSPEKGKPVRKTTIDLTSGGGA
jgi:mRNA-degrading endonuclease RelE of RelBE toxin-antitoxin system